QRIENHLKQTYERSRATSEEVMIQREQKRSDRGALRQRREQVIERLAAFGFTRGPHRVVREGHRWNTAESVGLKLRIALSELGPIFSSFGRYLATRVDL